MYKYGKTSRARLNTCHPILQEIFNEAIKVMDISILCGHRDEEAQRDAFKQGNSKVQYPNSKHNSTPSMAVDAAPYWKGIDWEDKRPFYYLAGIILAIAHDKGYNIRWGGDWNGFIYWCYN
jgi:hypothetical protein